MAKARKEESWGSRFGVILAVAGSAIGLGNFLRFPGQAAQYGGGAFMLAYFVAFLIIGLPICWVEWSLGRYAGNDHVHSTPGIFAAIIRKPIGKYLGIIGVLIPVVAYMYYVNVEAWCLGYAVNFLTGNMNFSNPDEAKNFFNEFVGTKANGSALGLGIKQIGIYLIAAFALNFVLIYRGLSKGIEFFCKYAMPTLMVVALIVLVRVLTLGSPIPEKPENKVSNGLGFMWNPSKVLLEKQLPSGEWVKESELVDPAAIAAAELEISMGNVDMMNTVHDEPVGYRLREITMFEQLKNPQLWLAAAGQSFFSLSLGFGVIISYASYLNRKDDIVLSALTATSASEVCQVGLGGLMTLPAGVAFLGVAGVAGMGAFGLGFNVLPLVFAKMPFGQLFGFLFFFLLLLAAVTSSLSQLQPCVAFLEESLRFDRKKSVALLVGLTGLGAAFVVTFSQDMKALDTMDFWIGNFLIYTLSTIEVILFGWVLGIDKAIASANEGAAFQIPKIYHFVIKYLSPIFLISVFVLWMTLNVFGFNFKTGEANINTQIRDLFIEPNRVAWMSIIIMLAVGTGIAMIVRKASKYKELEDTALSEGLGHQSPANIKP